MISPDCTIKPASKPESGARLCWEPDCRKPLPKYARKWCSAHGGRFQVWLRNHKWWAARDFALLAACVSEHLKGAEFIKKYPRNDGFGPHCLYTDPCETQCAICHKSTDESPEVDHKIPMEGDARDRPDCRHHEANLRVLCHDCHSRVSAVQAKARAAARRGKAQMEFVWPT